MNFLLMVCLLLWPICKCYSEYIFIYHVSDIIQTFVCVFVKFASVIIFFFKFQTKFSKRYVE